ncbi:MAG: hypothetical protein ACK5M7_03095 [Draconibacterium sp.]
MKKELSFSQPGVRELEKKELKEIESGGWFGKNLWWIVPVAAAIGMSV